MWGNSQKRNSSSRIDTLIGRHTEVHGDVHFSGGLHVDGKVKGNVVAEGDTEATLSVSEHGSVEGEVAVPHVVLNGTVTGDVRSSERVELSVHARVAGDVYYNLIEMAIGAAVNGKLVHQPGEQPMLALDHERTGAAGEASGETGGAAGEEGADIDRKQSAGAKG